MHTPNFHIKRTETTHSIRSIANHLGFSDEHYFANVFKQKTGFSPSQYRKSRSNIV
ncbi:MAG: AraC family transcriptional regulator [Oscillospiraceae bacterium]|nr:AraC family transcriptional regulator [Oscillospiraceae bacterium]